ncbi:MAG: DUF3576 domain-containing protein, partial [Planctomycetes bacterium]|nr:DUF3576 domain-containing protein [Planctomycetota bacterium]
MNRLALAALALACSTSAGCMGYYLAPVEPVPTSRLFRASPDRVWEAALQALRTTPLSSVDKASGIIVTDWRRGLSDVRYWGTRGKPRAWLDIRFKMTVAVRPAPGGARVSVDLFEETNVPRTVTRRVGGGFGSASAHPRHPWGARS